MPLAVVLVLYAAYGDFRTFVNRQITGDTDRGFHDRAYAGLCKDGSLRLADAAKFAWDEVYFYADEEWLVARFGEAARVPSSSENPPPAYVFVRDGRVVRIFTVTGPLIFEGGNRPWPRNVHIEFTGPPTPERAAATLEAHEGPGLPVPPGLVTEGCAAIDTFR
ncbi:hypothetical protein [Yinghuangia soli]|uniref:Uncharacterized protein n=1 Tax=Yinghuangia soli TaxID=2908204 RepID=A0AA41Q1G0_9ACTN|nr:hypothetical protein [Yinghuangia soli]MCF2528327.1 hypothetical protein [Yinghuangia soli]